MLADISEFHKKFELQQYGDFKKTPDDFLEFRERFLQEEAEETMKAMGERDKPGALDGLVDLAYVAMGTVYTVYDDPEKPQFARDDVGLLDIAMAMDDVGLLDIAMAVDGVNLGPFSAQWLLDLSYGCMQIANSLNWNFTEAWSRVHNANMQKVRAARVQDSKRDSGFDVVKPPGWKAPDLSDLVY